jgi:hypothetical protein
MCFFLLEIRILEVNCVSVHLAEPYVLGLSSPYMKLLNRLI